MSTQGKMSDHFSLCLSPETVFDGLVLSFYCRIRLRPVSWGKDDFDPKGVLKALPDLADKCIAIV